ncbi:uncharacterized protein TRAVEDRAFT_65713 [Trametes versicolor FP-101664 SS1]|uniref:uncharacterized protein n=1 Tax=Trametes versicolor (strain FP-101664) TaxID=717944 RepID=UPI0004623C3E|nr:uncharacterized protein TRAVEDRAFT_65713 [Trametes versicolor FP-101664 SS1]EIW56534.1 hypothetical protein TRAVEDRAFT_65713 [Trametes versicolor FP-101664 SS1]
MWSTRDASASSALRPGARESPDAAAPCTTKKLPEPSTGSLSAALNIARPPLIIPQPSSYRGPGGVYLSRRRRPARCSRCRNWIIYGQPSTLARSICHRTSRRRSAMSSIVRLARSIVSLSEGWWRPLALAGRQGGDTNDAGST